MFEALSWTRCLGTEGDDGANVLFREARELSRDGLGPIAVREMGKDDAHEHSRTLDGWLPVAHGRIGNDSFTPVHG